MNQVLICDAETRSALSAMRDLHAQGVSVVLASYKKNALSFYSRYAKECVVYPNPSVKQSVFVSWVDEYMKKYPNLVVMSFTDITTDALRHCLYQQELKHVHYIPAQVDYVLATHKRSLATRARSLGIPVPEEIDMLRIHEESYRAEIAFPVIVKPVRSVSWDGEGKAYKDTAHIVYTVAELLEQYAHLSQKTTDTPLVQKMLKGDEFGVSLIAQNGVILTAFAHQRLRSITPHGGVSTLRKSVALTSEMSLLAEHLTKSLHWNGVMMIELKRNNETGALTLIEINARFWGSLFLAIISGVHFPYFAYLLGVGNANAIRQCTTYTVNVHARHFVTDLSYFYALGRKAFAIRHIREFFGFWGKDLYFDVWSWRDLLPGWVELFQFIRKKI